MQFIKIIIINGSGELKPDDGKKEEKEKSYYSKKREPYPAKNGTGNGKI